MGESDVDVRVVKALNHPTRVRILDLLRGRELVSPVELATELGIPLGTVGYHVRRLEELGFLELAKRTRRRGAIEHHYRARAMLEDPRIGEAPPHPVSGPGAEAVRIVEGAQAALAHGGFDAVAALAARREVRLDGDGRASLRAALKGWEETLARIERESVERLAETRTAAHACAAVVMVFGDAADAA